MPQYLEQPATAGQGVQGEITMPGGGVPLPERESMEDRPRIFTETTGAPHREQQSVEQQATPQAQLQGEHIDHALAFYGAVLDEYAGISDPLDPGHAEAAAQWDEANGLMIDYALDMQDLSLAGQCYGYMTNPANKWAQVAKVHHAGYPLIAEDWRAPLMQHVERGEYSTQDLLAMHKARASMAFDRVSMAADGEARQEEMYELNDAINDTLQLLAAERGTELVPKTRPYDRNAVSDIDPELDVRKHMFDLIKLCADNGSFDTARDIVTHAERVESDVRAYGNMDYSLQVTQAIENYASTLELRELCFGLTADEVLDKSKTWKPDKGYSKTTEAIAKLLNNPSAYSGNQGSDLTTAVLFLEEQYPSIQLDCGYDRCFPHYSHRLEVLLKNKEWNSALLHYDHRLSMAQYGSQPQLSSLRNALLVARHEPEITTSQLVAEAAADTVAIEQLVVGWRAAQIHDETYSLPGLRAKASRNLCAYANKTYGLAAVQRGILRSAYTALAEVDPRDTTVKDLIKKYVKNRTDTLRLLPDYETAAAAELAELQKLGELTR